MLTGSSRSFSNGSHRSVDDDRLTDKSSLEVFWWSMSSSVASSQSGSAEETLSEQSGGQSSPRAACGARLKSRGSRGPWAHNLWRGRTRPWSPKLSFRGVCCQKSRKEHDAADTNMQCQGALWCLCAALRASCYPLLTWLGQTAALS